MSFSLMTLGAGQEVGRSCVIANVNGIRVMFDCGVHMVYNDCRKFPDFRRINPNSRETAFDKNIYANLVNTKDIDFNKLIDLVVISHFHLDHCGALPYFTEVCKYSGPIIMTQPTKSIFPITLEDFRRIISDMKGEKSLITNDDIQTCLRKITTIELNEEKIINDKLRLTCFYAGHVLGAAMFQVEYNGFSVTYTGDYNTVVDRHLNAAYLPKLTPNVLITETTYGDTIRDTKRVREREFLKKVSEVLEKNGKILIPIFALGRAQELCILLDTHWKRKKLNIPIYFYGAMSEKSNFYYKIFNNWTNDRIKSIFLEHNVFNFQYVTSNNQSKQNEAYKQPNTPMVILSTPGMLHGGTSLNIFKEICNDKNSCVIIPGYCTSGTVGHKILSGEKQVEIDQKLYQVCCDVYYMSFSAHADAKGLLHLIKNSSPSNLVLVHGDPEIMKTFKSSVSSLLPKINTYMPPNYNEIVFDQRFIYKQIGIGAEMFEIIRRNFTKNYLNMKIINKNVIIEEPFAKEKASSNLILPSNFVSNFLNSTLTASIGPVSKQTPFTVFTINKFFKRSVTCKIDNKIRLSLAKVATYKHNLITYFNEYLIRSANHLSKIMPQLQSLYNYKIEITEEAVLTWSSTKEIEEINKMNNTVECFIDMLSEYQISIV